MNINKKSVNSGEERKGITISGLRKELETILEEENVIVSVPLTEGREGADDAGKVRI